PLDPAAVLRGDERRQLLAVVVRGHRRETATADGEDAGALRLDAAAGLGVVGSRNELLLAGTDLQRERALARLGQQLGGIEPQADLSPEPQPVEAGRGEHDRVQPALAALAQPRIDVPAERLDRQLWFEREQLRLAPDRRGADAHPRAYFRRSAERVARVLSRQIGADDKAFRVRRGHVLRRVDGDVDPPGQERFLDLLDEHAPRADLTERLRPVLVARGRDRHERDLDAVPAQLLRRELGLRQGEAATPAADPQEHRAGLVASSAARRHRLRFTRLAQSEEVTNSV